MVLLSNLSRVEVPINTHAPPIKDAPRSSPIPEFTVNQPSTIHHYMELRYQTEVPTNTPHVILFDNHTQPTLYFYTHPSYVPHIIPPDYIPSINMAANFKKFTINQLLGYLSKSPTMHHVFNELIEQCINYELTPYCKELMVPTDHMLHATNGTNWQTEGCERLKVPALSSIFFLSRSPVDEKILTVFFFVIVNLLNDNLSKSV